MNNKHTGHSSDDHSEQTHGKGHDHKDSRSAMGSGHYGRLAAMAGLSFVAMFILMYSMVDAFSNVFIHVNQAYMAGLMTAPMIIIELALMGAMYKNTKANVAFIAGSIVLLAVCWFGIRKQVAVGDSQFLRSMIPHHAGALLMCDEASITDARVKDLCERIRQSQTSEIAEMKALLKDVK